jgi:hypothetical protein
MSFWFWVIDGVLQYFLGIILGGFFWREFLSWALPDWFQIEGHFHHKKSTSDSETI